MTPNCQPEHDVGPGDNAAPAGRVDRAADDPRVVRAVAEYVAALEAGQHPSRQELLDRYPEVADAVAACLDGLAVVFAAAPGLRSLSGGHSASGSAADVPRSLGDFRILREIGRGGMGVVYEAEQLSLGRRVAVKVLPFAAALDGARLRRFKNEAQAAAQLHHTNIVPVYAVGCDRGVHFYAMQLIEGRSLANVIQELRGDGQEPLGSRGADGAEDTDPWPANAHAPSAEPAAAAEALAAQSTASGRHSGTLAQISHERKTSRSAFHTTVARWGIQAAEALEHAHQMGVIHRDVKPANVLVDAQSKIWIADFGLAQFHAEAGLTATGNMAGTIRYMSPEQASGERVVLDHRTDIYSLGVTLYELLTGRPAFDDSDRRVLARHIAAEEPRAPRAIDKTIPADLETIVLKAMAKAAADRYDTAQALADDLQRFLDQQPIRARRPTPIERVVKWSRRHRPVVASGVLLLLLAALGLLASTVLIAREHAKTKAAYASERIKAQEADQQRQQAEARFRQARRAVDLLAEIGEDELTDAPFMQNVRRRILEATLDYYQDFIEDRTDDAALQADLIASRTQVQRILSDLADLRGFGQTMKMAMLLEERDAQRDLGLSQEQIDEIEAAQKQRWDRGSPDRKFHELSASEKHDHFQQEAEEQAAAIRGWLTPQQQARLKQIELQVRGLSAWTDTDVEQALALSDEQRASIRALVDASHGAGPGFDCPPEDGPPRGPPPGERPPGEPRPREASFDEPARREPPPQPPHEPRDQGNEGPNALIRRQIESLLTSQQRQSWAELIGDTYLGRAMRPRPPGEPHGHGPRGFGDFGPGDHRPGGPPGHGPGGPRAHGDGPPRRGPAPPGDDGGPRERFRDSSEPQPKGREPRTERNPMPERHADEDRSEGRAEVESQGQFDGGRVSCDRGLRTRDEACVTFNRNWRLWKIACA
ncbi:MAG: serine/threonine protein kinase [Planctomycetia bacterium]|nr:serine/threonine protein kinase [Planctomycetia bacterium]